MPGRDLWIASPDSFRDRRVPNFDTIDPNIKPMYQDSTNVGIEYQFSADDGVRRALHPQQPAAGRSRTWARSCTATRSTSSATRAKGSRRRLRHRHGADRAVRDAEAEAAVRRAGLDANRRFSKNWFGSANYTLQPAVRQLRGLANSDEITHADDRRQLRDDAAAGGQHRAPGRQRDRAWDLDELMLDSHGNLDVASAVWPPIVRTS